MYVRTYVCMISITRVEMKNCFTRAKLFDNQPNFILTKFRVKKMIDIL